METIAQIKAYLQKQSQWNDRVDQYVTDSRKGVQQAIEVFKKRLEKEAYLQEHFIRRQAFDQSYLYENESLLAGVDEVGRGPLAGPVVTAAVVFEQVPPCLLAIDDSKKLSKEQREKLAQLIKTEAVSYAVHIQPARVIDEINIYQATKQSMEQVVKELTVQPDMVLVDAMDLTIPYRTEAIIKADEKSLVVAAASILAKVERDRWMTELHQLYPAYGFSTNAGYGTKEHLNGIKETGICPEHRRSFEPIKSLF